MKRRNYLIIAGLIISLILLTGFILINLNKHQTKIKLSEQTMNNRNQDTKPNYQSIRPPAVADQFYPAQADKLSAMLNEFLTAAQPPDFTGQPQILIVPHAGYIFSGPTAAYAYKTIQNKNYDNIIILGPSHHYLTQKLTLYDGDAVQTPLDIIPTNRQITQQLINDNQNIIADDRVHAPEHSLEVQLPFLQKTLKNRFKVVLGLINNENPDTLASVAKSIKKILSQFPHTLIIISSDLSHYPNYNDAIHADRQTIQAILSKDINRFNQTTQQLLARHLTDLETCACGASTVQIGMLLAKELNLTGYQLHYSNSGDIPIYGDKSRVVGYGAIVFTKPKNKALKNSGFLTQTEQTIALKLARHILERAFGLTQKDYQDYKNYPVFFESRGVFVTLYNKNNGQLRGCIGLIEPIKPLAEGIIEMAQAAAFHDPRFIPLTKQELNNIKIEISVLTQPQPIKNIKEIQLGKHGVIIRRGNRSGVYLPQVATETGWNLTTFLSNLCVTKAGLETDCWQNPATQIYTFEAQVFKEK